MFVTGTFAARPDHMSFLIPGHDTFGMLNKGSQTYYELYTKDNKNSQLLIEAFECKGKVNLLASKKRKDIMHGAYDLKLSTPISNAKHLIGIYNLEQNPTYLGILNKAESFSSYVLRTQFIPKGVPTPYDALVPGRNGEINWIT
jgi:hypothetical protein